MQPPRMENDMSIYAKLANARAAFHELKLAKSGHNKFQGYKYFELADFLIPGMNVLRDAGLVPVISFDAAQATMTVYETGGDGVITITSPMADVSLKAAHPIQNLGAVQTYQRRYLWMALLEIVEHDAVDSSPPAEEPSKPALSDERFADLLPKWAAMIGTGKPPKTAEMILASVEAKGSLTNEQRYAILGLAAVNGESLDD